MKSIQESTCTNPGKDHAEKKKSLRANMYETI
jgi:hypothetical protein